jgi:GNAT superfamily N-acetyltransferase
MGDNGSSILRPATAADAPALERVLFDTFDSTWRPNISESAALAYVQENRPAAYIAARGLLFRVVEVGGDIAGFVDWEGDFINALHVRSAHARQGVGRALMDHAEAEIAKAGF